MAQVREDLRHSSWLTVPRVVGVVVLAAAVSVALLSHLITTFDLPDKIQQPVSWWILGLFVVLAAISDVVYVPVRHADAWEELTFVEVVLIWAMLLLLPPLQILGAALIGFLFVEVLARRQLIKVVFNMASYTVSAVGLMVTYLLLVGNASPFSVRSIAAVIVAAVVFTTLNLVMLSLVLLAADGVHPREFIGEQATLTLGMAVGAVGIATVGLAIEQFTPVLLPFAALPAAAMWSAYRASSSHAEARQRSAWLVRFGQAVSSLAPAEQLLPDAADALRRVYGADEYAVLLGDGRAFGHAEALRGLDLGPQDAVDLPPAHLPEGWSAGVAVPLQLKVGQPGVLAIGVLAENYRGLRLPWSRSWSVPETEISGLVALTSAVSSALQAGLTLTALTSETAKLQAVVNHATDGICVVNGSGEVMLWSPAAQAITGVDEPENPMPDVVKAIIAVPADTQGHPVDFERADGQQISLQVTRVDVYGSAATSVITIRDMTRERRAERLKSDFIATISHELRTPITPIRGYADLLKRRWDRMSEDKRASVLDTIAERADHLARLVDDLLMAARADTETSLRVDMTSVDIVALVREAAIAFPEVDGRLRFEESPPMMVLADPTRVTQIVGNLVGNALKYTPAGTPIEIGYSRDAAMVEVRVTDHGQGIAADEHEKVFERFYRIEDPLTMRTGGSGLGLHISRQLARAMGGDVRLKSSPGEGSTFILRLRAEG